MVASFTAETYEPIEAGVYPATLVGIEEAESEQFGKFRKWTFAVDLGDGGEAYLLSAPSSPASGPKSKAYKWASALLGRAPVPGEPVNLEGKKCSLHVIVNEDGFNRVESVLPVPTTRRPATGKPAGVISSPTGDVEDVPF